MLDSRPTTSLRRLFSLKDGRLLDVPSHGSRADANSDGTDARFANMLCGEPLLRLTQGAYGHIMEYHTAREPEVGGMLLGPVTDDLVTHFVPDETGHATATSFTLDAAAMNRSLVRHRRCGMNAKGLVHLHPPGVTWPSCGDVQYVAKSFANPRNKDAVQFLLPIVCEGRLYPYVILRGDDLIHVLVANLLLV